MNTMIIYNNLDYKLFKGGRLFVEGVYLFQALLMGAEAIFREDNIRGNMVVCL